MKIRNEKVDAGYPKRIGCGPLHRKDLQAMLAK